MFRVLSRSFLLTTIGLVSSAHKGILVIHRSPETNERQDTWTRPCMISLKSDGWFWKVWQATR
jgi:hypothetical protein